MLKEIRRNAVVMIISFGYSALATSVLALKEYQEEINQYREYISSGKAGKYGEIKEVKRNWDTEIPPIGYKPDHLTEI